MDFFPQPYIPKLAASFQYRGISKVIRTYSPLQHHSVAKNGILKESILEIGRDDDVPGESESCGRVLDGGASIIKKTARGVECRDTRDCGGVLREQAEGEGKSVKTGSMREGAEGGGSGDERGNGVF